MLDLEFLAVILRTLSILASCRAESCTGSDRDFLLGKSFAFDQVADFLTDPSRFAGGVPND